MAKSAPLSCRTESQTQVSRGDKGKVPQNVEKGLRAQVFAKKNREECVRQQKRSQGLLINQRLRCQEQDQTWRKLTLRS